MPQTVRLFDRGGETLFLLTTPTLKKETKKDSVEYSKVNVQMQVPQTPAGCYDVSIL